ncbi:MAG: ATP-binding cassette domain-containing protein [Candidatus Manganitrophus sp.]|nr:ATP-binding cassette domain-containing protein [Candidatus Manganitrophus sp.]
MSIQLQGVTKRYGRIVAVQPIDLKIDGEICGLIGNNGAGKSTLMKMITGLLHPDAGRVEINGIDSEERSGGGQAPDRLSPRIADALPAPHAGRAFDLHRGD